MPSTIQIELRERVHADAVLIGIRPAARKHGVNEQTALTWARREGWKLPQCLLTLRQANRRPKPLGALNPDATRIHTLNALSQAIDEQGVHSQAYLSGATLQASYELSQNAGQTEGEKIPYAGLLNAARTGDIVHGWQAARAQPQAPVQVAVVLQTEDERSEKRDTDRKLDEITALLREKQNNS